MKRVLRNDADDLISPDVKPPERSIIISDLNGIILHRKINKVQLLEMASRLMMVAGPFPIKVIAEDSIVVVRGHT